MESVKNSDDPRRLLDGLHGGPTGTLFSYDPALRSWIVSPWLGSEAIIPEDDLREFVEQFLAISAYRDRLANSARPAKIAGEGTRAPQHMRDHPVRIEHGD